MALSGRLCGAALRRSSAAQRVVFSGLARVAESAKRQEHGLIQPIFRFRSSPHQISPHQDEGLDNGTNPGTLLRKNKADSHERLEPVFRRAASSRANRSGFVWLSGRTVRSNSLSP